MTGETQRRWRPEWPCPAQRILLQHRRGGGDPTMRVDGASTWRAARTPQGTVSLCVTALPDLGEVSARAWGAGAEWALETLPTLLGAADDLTGFEPRHPLVAEGRRRNPNWRLSRTGLVMESLVPSVIEQKVTGQEAFAGFRRLVRKFGEPAPGPGDELGLWVQPDAETIRTIPSWEWLQLHIDPARSRTLVRAAQVAPSLQRLVARTSEEFDQALCSLPGIGEWTSAEVRARVLGDPDAVSFGDYHVAKDVGWAVTGAPFSDAEMADFLDPWRPHRGRVVAYLAMAAGHRPRRGPRMAPRTHLPARGTWGP